jgi:hypothetical protein
MSDDQKVRAECRAARAEDREISDACAQVIASQWHRGQASAGYSFVSTGAFDHPHILWRELFSDAYSTMGTGDRFAADMLGTYLLDAYRANGNQPRGPVTGWSDLWL